MYENEGDDFDSQSDASEGSPSEPSSNEGQESATKQVADKPQQEPPFHEHPRFKELIEQKNHAQESTRQMQAKIAELEARFSQPAKASQPERDELIEDLKKIDPRLADRLMGFSKSASEVEKLMSKITDYEQREQQRSTQTFAQTAIAKINSLHESNKVAPEVRQMIQAHMDLQYMQGRLSLQNIEQLYKEQLAPYQKYEEAIRRLEREQYVKAKKADSSVPSSQPKGAPAKQGVKKPVFSQDKEVARAQVVSRFLKNQAAAREAGG